MIFIRATTEPTKKPLDVEFDELNLGAVAMSESHLRHSEKTRRFRFHAIPEEIAVQSNKGQCCAWAELIQILVFGHCFGCLIWP